MTALCTLPQAASTDIQQISAKTKTERAPHKKFASNSNEVEVICNRYTELIPSLIEIALCLYHRSAAVLHCFFVVVVVV